MFPQLTEDDVEVRVAQCSDKGVSLLLYKDARVDMRLLDEVVGPMNWQRKHEFKDGRLYCSVGLRGEDGWVWKEDVGVPSNMESDKGQASDSFKRACFNWGIGRELYTVPRIWVRADCCNVKQNNNGKWQCYDRFSVTEMEVEDGCITSLAIANDSMKGRKVFSWKRGEKPESEEKPAPNVAKRAAWAAINRYAELHNADPNVLAQGVKKRPDYEDTEEFWQRVESEFLNEC